VYKRQLPAPDKKVFLNLQEAFVAPRTSIEEQLTEIWAGLLGMGRVSIHDNFFDLGGHSLLAAQLLSRVNEAFQVELSLRSLFETPTVAGLAMTVVQSQAEQEDSGEIGRILAELEGLSGEEAQAMLDVERQRTVA